MSIVFIVVFLCPAESLGGSDVLLSIALFLEYNHSLTHEKKIWFKKKTIGSDIQDLEVKHFM